MHFSINCRKQEATDAIIKHLKGESTAALRECRVKELLTDDGSGMNRVTTIDGELEIRYPGDKPILITHGFNPELANQHHYDVTKELNDVN